MRILFACTLTLLCAAAVASAQEAPLPVDGREYVDPAEVLLSWTPPASPPSPVVRYVVKLDTDEAVILDPEGDADHEIEVGAFDYPRAHIGALDFDTTYYWRVDSTLQDDTVLTGDAWSFSTEPTDVPGVVVDYSPDPANVYLMSPSIAILEDGRYLVGHDVSGPGPPNGRRTVLLESADGGVNWKQVAQVDGLHWASLFLHRGSLYLFGVWTGSKCAILRSDDDGRTWTNPVDESTGILFPDNKYHTAPVPVVVHDGRIWRAMEDLQDPGEWAVYFRAFMMSAPVDADLLRASSWTSSNRVSFDESRWAGAGWLEGNAVAAPNGGIVNVLRVADVIPSIGVVDTAAVISVSGDGTTSTFDPATGFIDFPGGGVKFDIRFDEETGHYWALVNPQREPYAMRNRLCLSSSPDLVNWTIRAELISHWDPVFHGWHYVDWLFEGDDIVFASRTAFPASGEMVPHDYHDANFTTFHRIDDFRALLPAPPGDGDDWPGGDDAPGFDEGDNDAFDTGGEEDDDDDDDDGCGS